MAAGTNLWHGNLQIESEDSTFNMKFHMAEIDEAEARTRVGVIGSYVRYLLPNSCEVSYAVLSKDDSKPDGRYIPDAVGLGLYGQSGSAPADTFEDAAQTCLNIRREHVDGGHSTMKIAPLPDGVVTASALTTVTAGVVAPVVGAIGAPGSGADWFAELTLLLKYLVVKTHHVKSGHAPGGAFEYFAWAAMFPRKIKKKKGSRVRGV